MKKDDINAIVEIDGEKCIPFRIGYVGDGMENEFEVSLRDSKYRFKLSVELSDFLRGIHRTIRQWGPGPDTPIGKGLRDSLKAVHVAESNSERKPLIPIPAEPVRIVFRGHYIEAFVRVYDFQQCAIEHLRTHPILNMGGYNWTYTQEMKKLLVEFIGKAA
jgi:hypothetical protein